VKAVLEFSLPEERAEHIRATKATEMMLLVWELDRIVKEMKSKEKTEAGKKVCDRVIAEIWREIKDRGLMDVFD
jgi:predicted kinase